VRELNKSNVEHVITEYRYRIDYYAPVTNQGKENLKLFDTAGVLIEEFNLSENTEEMHSVILGLNSFLNHKRMRKRKRKALEFFQWLLKSVIVPIVVTIITTWIIMKYFSNG
jgi:ABC-type maltose transport system permease subunit